MVIKSLIFLSISVFAEESIKTLQVTSIKNKEKRLCLKIRESDVRLGDLVLLNHPIRSTMEALINHKVDLQEIEALNFTTASFIEKITETFKSVGAVSLKNTRVVYQLSEVPQFSVCSLVNEYFLTNLASLIVSSSCSACQIRKISNLHHINLLNRPSSAVLSGRDNSQVTFIGQKNENNFFHDITVEAPVLVTKVGVKKGQDLESSLFVKLSRQINLGQLNYLVPSDFKFDAYKASQALPAMQTLRLSDLQKKELVIAGQTVKGIIYGPMFEIETIVIAKRSGIKNETIPVQNIDTKRIFSGRITGSGEVEIIE